MVVRLLGLMKKFFIIGLIAIINFSCSREKLQFQRIQRPFNFQFDDANQIKGVVMEITTPNKRRLRFPAVVYLSSEKVGFFDVEISQDYSGEKFHTEIANKLLTTEESGEIILYGIKKKTHKLLLNSDWESLDIEDETEVERFFLDIVKANLAFWDRAGE